MPKQLEPKPPKCGGSLYCDQAKENIFFDENDEQFCLFIVQDDKQEDKMIPYKSIFLDLLERQKTITSIKKACPHLSANQIDNIPENILFRLRKFFSIGDVTASPLFKHMKVSNFYYKVRVCFYCANVYDKIDAIRNERLLRRKRQKIDDQYIRSCLEKINFNYFSSHLQQQLKKRMNERMSQLFFEKLDQFDRDKEKFDEEFIVSKRQDDKFFAPKKKSIFNLTQDQQCFQLPTIQRVTLRDKQGLIKKKVNYVSPDQAEALGLKHYLGHVQNLPFSDQGLAISKSSLELNKLQDKIRDIEQLKERLENERIQKIREEIELVMCTYYGNGKANKDRLIDFVETLKKRDNNDAPKSVDSRSIRQIQIVTDKNDFLSENQKKQKQDKEKKEAEIQETKKNFMEMNSQLASSVIKRFHPNQDYSPSKGLEYISEDSEMY